MAGIVEGLFGLNAQDLQQQQNENDALFSRSVASVYKRPSAKLGALVGANIGQGLARGLFNIQDPRIQRATQMEQLLAEAQQESQSVGQTEAMKNLSKKLADNGFAKEAVMVGQQAQQLEQEQIKNAAYVKAQEANAQKDYAAANAPSSNIGKLLQDRDKAYANTLLSGGTEADAIAAAKPFQEAIAKENYIKEKELNTGEIVNKAIYNDFLTKNGGDVTKASYAYDEYEKTKRKEIQAAGVPAGGADFSNALKFKDQIRTDLTPIKEKVSSIQEALNIASLAKSNPTASTQLDSFIVRLTQEGKLSNADIDRVVSTGSFDQRLTDSIQRFFYGQPSDLSLGQKTQVLNTLLKVRADELNTATTNFRETFKSTDLNPDFVDKALKGYTYNFGGSKPAPSKPATTGKTSKGTSYKILE